MGAVILALAGCAGLALLNDPPDVGIESPESGSYAAAGEPFTITAYAQDDQDAASDLLLSFSAAGATIDGDLVRFDDGTFSFTTTLPAGDHDLTLRAVDTHGESATAAITLHVVDDAAPSVRFSSPAEGGFVAALEPVAVAFAVTDDAAGGLPALTLSWEGAPDGPTELAAAGTEEFAGESIAEGSARIAVTVTDALGKSGSTAVRFTAVARDPDLDAHDDLRLGGDDCDSQRGDVHPGADEVCNDVDDDCDGSIDEEPVDGMTWYADADADGWGDGPGVVACVAPAAHVSVSGDCDDLDAAVSPAAEEVCNGIDDDCADGVDLGAIDPVVWYADTDGDGYGAGTGTPACEAPVGTVASSGDCDDACAACSPAGFEVCDARDLDEDCDGGADDLDDDPGFPTTVYTDADGDGRGDPATAAARCDPDADQVDNAEDCDDTDADAWSGAADVCEDGSDNDCAGGDANCALSGRLDLSDSDAIFTGVDALDLAGAALAFVGDTDGDGADDLAVGAWGHDGSRGALILATGITGGSLGGFVTWTGEAVGDAAGYSVASAGDTDGDGVGDVIVGAETANGGTGAAYVILGGGTGGSLAGAAAWALGSAADGGLGTAVAGAGDADGDGSEDLLFSAPGVAAIGIVHGPVSGTMVPDAKRTGSAGAGASADFAGDVDGDGSDDIVIGSPDESKVYLLLGDPAGTASLATADVIWSGESASDEAGASVSRAGDVDGDGHDDVLVGAPENDAGTTGGGAVYLMSGDTAATSPLTTAAARIRGPGADDHAGYTVSGGGDSDGDGLSDVLVGAYNDDTGGAGAGAAYLFYGSLSGTRSTTAADARFIGEEALDGASEGLCSRGDPDGDGFDDLAIGAPSADDGAGAVYLVIGGGG